MPKSAIEQLIEIKNNYFDGYALKSYSQEWVVANGIYYTRRVLFYLKSYSFLEDARVKSKEIDELFF